MKVLIIGKGGREHALAYTIAKSEKVDVVFVAPGNCGMQGKIQTINIEENDVDALVNFAKDNKIDLSIVGPESSLALGVVDEFQKNGLRIFGPDKKSAQIETSKSFAKDLMKKYNIPTAKYEVFDNFKDAFEFIHKISLPFVIKEDGLKSGKGVSIVNSIQEAKEILEKIFSQKDNKVVIEEFMQGFEFSMIAMICDENIIPLPIAQDHKRAFDNDEGKNTGGMGTYSPVLKIDENIQKMAIEDVFIPTIKALKSEGYNFNGFLFAGLMLTKDGVKVIEFNARLGDPEAQSILPRIQNDLFEVIMDLIDSKVRNLEISNEYCMCVVMSAKNYPNSSSVGVDINIDKDIDAIIFHMGTMMKDNKLQTNGGRVLSVVCMGENLKQARDKVYQEIKKIKCEDLRYRMDIGNKSL